MRIHRGLLGIGDATSDLQTQIKASAQQYGIDPSFALAVAKVESGFKPNVVSPAGAIGIMQLMPATAASLGVNPNDPTQNIDGGVKLLSQLLTQYGGDESKALWAYNAGPGNVAKGIMPKETQNYIPAVLSAQALFGGSYDAPSAGAAPPVPGLTTSDDSSSDDSTDTSDTVQLAGVDVPVDYLMLGAAAIAGLVIWRVFA